MKKIFIRSPYYIQVAETGQTGSKIEVFLWNYTDTEPTTPTYTLSKEIPSPSQIETSYNVANLAKDFITITYPTTVTVPTKESEQHWCFMTVKRYKYAGGVYVHLDDETFACLPGYDIYTNGANNSTVLTDTELNPLYSTVPYYYNLNPYFNVIVQTQSTDYEFHVDYYNSSNVLLNHYVTTYNADNVEVWKIPIKTNTSYIILSTYDTVSLSTQSEQTISIPTITCEPKYTPQTVAYINRYGGWQFLTFFKASKESIDVTNTKFNLMPEDLNYNIKIGQTRTLNHNGKQKIRMNTGFVQESYFELMQDLLLSEVVLIDNKPATVKTNSLDYKKRLDGLINYEVEFEYAFNLIQNVR